VIGKQLKLALPAAERSAFRGHQISPRNCFYLRVNGLLTYGGAMPGQLETADE